MEMTFGSFLNEKRWRVQISARQLAELFLVVNFTVFFKNTICCILENIYYQARNRVSMINELTLKIS